MGPKEFAELENRALSFIPDDGIQLSVVVNLISEGDDSGYGRTDAKAAILGLKADGRVTIDVKGIVRHT